MAEVLESLQRPAGPGAQQACSIWLDLTRAEGEAEGRAWDQARADLLARLNEWRSWLQQHHRRPLVVVLPLAWRARVPEVAPDLWHIRTAGLAVPQPGVTPSLAIAPVAAEEVAGALRDLRNADADSAMAGAEALFQRSRDAGQHEQAVQLASALEEAARAALADRPGEVALQRDLAVRLDALGDAQQEAGRGEAALAVYRESLALRRQLREALGESPQVLDDLAVSLERLADQAASAIDERRFIASEAVAMRERLVASMPTSTRMAQRLAVVRRIASSIADNSPRHPAADDE